MKHAIKGLLLTTALAFTVPAFGQDEAMRSVARKLGYEGVEAFQQGDFKTAAEKLGRAYKILRAPSLGLWSARAFEKNGQLVEASERYLEVKRLPTSMGADAQVQERSKADAAKEYEALQPRIPQLKIEVQGADPEKLEITLDGTPMPTAMIGMARPANPGNRRVEGKLGSEVVAAWVRLKEGEEKSVTLRFDGRGATVDKLGDEGEEGSKDGAAAAGDPGAPGADQGEQVEPGFLHTTAPWIAFGVGGAGLIAGGVFGVIAMGQKSELDTNCPDGNCEPEFYGDVDSYNTSRTISTIGFIVGGVGVAAGVTLLVTAPASPEADPPEETASITPWIGLGSVGVSGKF